MAIDKASSGSSNYVSTAASNFLQPGITATFMCWARPVTSSIAASQYFTVMGTHNTAGQSGWGISQRGDPGGGASQWECFFSTDGIAFTDKAFTTQIVTGRWDHITWVIRSDNSIVGYLNGKAETLQDFGSSGVIPATASKALQIGWGDAESNGTFGGSIAFPRIFAGELSDAEIRAEMFSDRARNQRVACLFDTDLRPTGTTGILCYDRGIAHAHISSVTGTVTFTNENPIPGPPVRRLARYYWLKGASGQSAAIGIATETDTVPALIEPPIFKAIETDTAQTLGRLSTTAITIASETDTAQTFGRLSTTALVKASEIDTAQLLGRLSTTAIGQALETDSAQTLGRLSTTAIILASEIDTAQTLGRLSTTAVNAALETDTALPISRLKAKLIGIATQNNIALVITPQSAGHLSTAFETDTAQLLGRLSTTAIGIALEIDTARIINAAFSGHPVNTAFENDNALGILSPAPGGVDIMRHFDSSVIFDTANILVTGVGLALTNTTNGAPERQCVMPGAEIAWDDCDCGGQLGVAIPRRYPSNSFPNEAVVIRDCENAIIVAQLIMNLARCAPSSSDDGSPPSCQDLMEAARRQEQDAYIVRATAQCILEGLERTSDLSNFNITEHVTVGPSGGCYATELKINVGFYINCGC